MLKLEVSIEWIHGSCALTVQLSEFRVMALYTIVEFMSKHICHVKDVNVDTILTACKHQVKESWGKLGNLKKIFCAHIDKMNCSKEMIFSLNWSFCYAFTTMGSFLNISFNFILIFTEITIVRAMDFMTLWL